MKKGVILSLWSIVLLSIVSYGSSKMVIPVEAPVEPVPAMQIPKPVYVGLGLSWGKYRGECHTPNCGYEDVTYGAMLRVGYEWNQYMGIEARAIATFLEEDDQGGQSLRYVGVFAKPMYPLGDQFNIYGLLGYGWTKTITGGNKKLPTIDESGFSAGAGLEYDLSSKMFDKNEDMLYDRGYDGYADQEKGWGLFLDYQRLLIKSDVPDMDVVSGGITYDF